MRRRGAATAAACGHGARTCLGLPWGNLACAECNGTRSVTCWRLTSRVQRLKERHLRSSLRRTEILSIGWTIPSARHNLANKLVFGEAPGTPVHRRTTLPPLTARE